jgi:hypothetical protein
MINRLLDRLCGDFVKCHAENIVFLRLTDFFRNMIGDCFAFAVRVGCEKDALSLFGLPLEILDDLLFSRNDDIRRRKIPFDNNSRGLFFGKSFNMTDRSLDQKILAIIFRDGFRLGRDSTITIES